MFDFLLQLPLWFWLALGVGILALAFFLARYFRVKSFNLDFAQIG